MLIIEKLYLVYLKFIYIYIYVHILHTDDWLKKRKNISKSINVNKSIACFYEFLQGADPGGIRRPYGAGEKPVGFMLVLHHFEAIEANELWKKQKDNGKTSAFAQFSFRKWFRKWFLPGKNCDPS